MDKFDELALEVAAPVAEMVKSHDPEGFNRWVQAVANRLRAEEEINGSK